MFYQSIESAYRAGQVRVGRPALGHGEGITIEARGLIRLKALFLSLAERQRLGELSKADASAYKASKTQQSEVMLSEYRHALNDALGFAEGEAFGLICMDYLGNHKHVGVAWSVEQQRIYLLFGGAEQPEPEYEPFWLLDMAKELTEFLRTLVVPDQASTEASVWVGVDHGPIMSYRFKLADSPTRLNI
ncbi:hypothetical protein DENIT_70010 [Pseudomonas veronii]|uniref:hypothetical protein n=1 Tax=Pseudomonas veronii TaxID=76761 RepID=UPI00176A4114|nr:hypothetical protein [Pseudomonas veronii]CAD0266033.1 hypothetical protein DENIT_70010 [Pseudomonas veronii]